MECNEPILYEAYFYSPTAGEQLLLTIHILPQDNNKYVCDLASFIFDPEEFTNKTTANLDKAKITFISSK